MRCGVQVMCLCVYIIYVCVFRCMLASTRCRAGIAAAASHAAGLYIYATMIWERVMSHALCSDVMM
jgi:hypothetical protein